MAIRVAIDHSTHYQYDRPINLGPHIVRLRPAPHSRTPIHAYSLTIRPEPHFINWQQDPFGNYMARLIFPEKTRELFVGVDLVAEMTVINPFDFFLEDAAKHYPFVYSEQLTKELKPYEEIVERGPLLTQWLAEVDRSETPTVDFLVALNGRLQRDIGYIIRMETGIQTCEKTLGTALGSCRDSAWLLTQILRHLGLAARFVSGYLVQLTADVKSLDGPSGPTADFTDLHAWTEVYLPGAGWVGLDPTSGLFAGEGHIPLSCTPSPSSAAPITGDADPCETKFHFHNRVTRIHEDPRVTKPYTEAQWLAVESLAQRVDCDLQANDVRLTLGGEPTFVSIDDMDGEQWNTAALGDDKRRLAGALMKRLQQRFAPDGSLYYGQGKWYPGEPLPRWALGCFWRTDGIPVWRDGNLNADENQDYGADEAIAEQFLRSLARRLHVNGKFAQPGYEDPIYYIWKEESLPEDVDPLQADLDDSLERRRLARLLEHGLNRPTGYVLPLHWRENEAYDQGHGQWSSRRWRFRRGRMFLLPGDSPMGYRLPLESLPPEKEPAAPEQDPFAPHRPLGDIAGAVAERYSVIEESATESASIPEQEAAWTDEEGDFSANTALCVEPRDGRLYVFLPPLSTLDSWIDLVACIESSAKSLDIPVIMEGYPPPHDPRLKRLLVTPDPGVIEVNIHPASDWAELAHTTEVLYEEARLSRLGTEKFMLDGRHSGTGGGNHVTLGGASATDSPFLRRPDLVRSLVTYWQHHPSLSYLFSGLFVGPTSQAPRVDEARDASLYELEIAFAEMPVGEVPQPWLVDRLLRNLLIDVSGNTHRTEFCIDKLYSPDSAAGRQGLVEMRAYEMPPHPHMSLMQMLLLRALIARFWKQPYDLKPVRWGTELHDRFMLPHYIWSDFEDVIRDLGQAGYGFEAEWFAPFLEFRFPHYGRVRVDDISVELRMAVEPWLVLGEETTSQGTARYVDSSLERLEVKATGITDSRHVLTCNGRRVPLRGTGTYAEAVAGVRYRAWQPPSALHPTIPSHAPLVFDIVDTWNGRSVGGCTYHVAHPGGRHYEAFPVNANEAEARRIARFWDYGHTPGPMQVPTEEQNPEYPYTLDLRRRSGG